MAKGNLKLHWPPGVTIDVVIFAVEKGQLKVLLVKRTGPPFQGNLALPGGFLLRDETTEKAARRVLKEKAGVPGGVYLEQLYTFDSPGRDPRGHVLTVGYFALVNPIKINFEAILAPVRKLPKLAFDHKRIIQYALRRLQYKLEYTNAVFSLLPKEFTFSQLQAVYELILGKKLDKRNFRKKFFALGLIKTIKRRLDSSPHRPAQLYTFKNQRPVELKRFF